MLVGHNNLKKLFRKLVEEKSLSHSYIFFGEREVGKYSFAVSLASFIEKGKFEKPEFGQDGFPKQLLHETLILKPKDGSLGIDETRHAKRFLAQKPIYTDKRIIIVDNAELLTREAQHALLKIAEEPLGSSLMILIVENADVLIPTLASRFQKIHFSRLKSNLIANLLEDDYSITKSKALSIAGVSLGRPGRAVNLALNEEAIEVHQRVKAFLAGSLAKRLVIDGLVEDPESIRPFFTELIAELAKEPVKNYDSLRSITERMTVMSQFNTNKRLQLESALWNI